MPQDVSLRQTQRSEVWRAVWDEFRNWLIQALCPSLDHEPCPWGRQAKKDEHHTIEPDDLFIRETPTQLEIPSRTSHGGTFQVRFGLMRVAVALRRGPGPSRR